MISKIIALAIALVLLASAPIYGAVVTPSTPIEFGAGDGTSIVVETPEDLQKVIAGIPDINSYLETEDMTELNPDFQSLTMVENGYGKTVMPSRTWMEVETPDGETENVRVYRETITTTSHILEIAFGVSGVYYTCTGETVTEILNWEMSEYDDDNKGGNVYSAEKTTQSYAFELYYAKDTVLVKYNDFGIENAACGFTNVNVYDMNGYPMLTYTPVEVDMEDSDERLQAATVDALSQCFGIWMQVELPEEGAEDAEPDYGDLENMTEEEQLQFYIDYMVEQLVYTYSTTMIQSFTQTNTQNIQYLVGLGTFMTTGIDNFNKFGGRYVLKSTDEARDAYLATVIPGSALTYKLNEWNSNVYFTTDSSEIDLVQIAHLSPRDSSVTQAKFSVETITTFKNIGNTVASVKDVEIKTVKEVFEGPFGDMFREMMESEEVESNG